DRAAHTLRPPWTRRRSAAVPRELRGERESLCRSDAYGYPRIRLRLTLPGQAFDGELVIARTECRTVEGNPEIAVGVLGQVIDDADAALVDAVDGDAEEPIG